MKELEKSELMEVDGGVLGIDDFFVSVAIGAVLALINDWDNFKKGIMSGFY